MKEVDAHKIDGLINELKDCNLKTTKREPWEPVGEDEECILDIMLRRLKTAEDLKLLDEYIDEVEEWKGIRNADSSANGRYALWLGPGNGEAENATEITSENGEYEVCDYASIVGLDFPKKIEERTPFLKTCTHVRAPNIKAAFVRGSKKLSEQGGEEEFVESIPEPGD
jgi:hypothetical protein